ncbi:hypothetical protein QFZ56_002404 [Streptomyces achromogenes]|uniref:Uncharacterized protein n=1 Tax=Streptomyces achromogenes TaxID=67255 RepID=A0ABU0PZS9_STRAH|nr:hypothetical protein [Streptomyces achromogenes]MDQ0683441.1 hypothetical protein [Streptomyces achromogenes]
MGAERETNHDMAAHDIAFLLAAAADEVEIGIAPTQALIRGRPPAQSPPLGGRGGHRPGGRRLDGGACGHRAAGR